MAGKRTAAMLAESFKKPNYEDLVAPQTSFRLNVLVTGKLKALSEMYPARSMNDIVNKLLGAALEDFEAGLKGAIDYVDPLPDGTEVEIYVGAEEVAEFHKLTEKYANELAAKIQKDQAKKRSAK